MNLRDTGVNWSRTGEEIIVLDMNGAEYFVLNHSGALLWESIAAAPRSAEELAELLERTYGVSPSQAQADVAAFTATLRAHGLADE
jgi:hypothetical protein